MQWEAMKLGGMELGAAMFRCLRTPPRRALVMLPGQTAAMFAACAGMATQWPRASTVGQAHAWTWTWAHGPRTVL